MVSNWSLIKSCSHFREGRSFWRRYLTQDSSKTSQWWRQSPDILWRVLHNSGAFAECSTFLPGFCLQVLRESWAYIRSRSEWGNSALLSTWRTLEGLSRRRLKWYGGVVVSGRGGTHRKIHKGWGIDARMMSALVCPLLTHKILLHIFSPYPNRYLQENSACGGVEIFLTSYYILQKPGSLSTGS